ncbi:MAG TPA: response regulator, partial [Tepidisphaeraceae bacterium]
ERIHQHALLTVSDTGRGMSDEMIGRLFSRFQQADGSVNRTQSGLGLGLAIAKHIVEGHHGTIEAKSDGVDRGSTFTVQLPVQAIRPDDYNASVPERLASLANALRDRSVLLVDDEESARTIVTACLQRAGARVTVTQSVAEAWEQLLQRQFDVLISDVGMPHESGYDLIRRLRQSDLPARSLPSLALTAFASIDDQTNAKRAGFDVYLTKPVEPLELIHRVAVLLDSAKPAAN